MSKQHLFLFILGILIILIILVHEFFWRRRENSPFFSQEKSEKKQNNQKKSVFEQKIEKEKIKTEPIFFNEIDDEKIPEFNFQIKKNENDNNEEKKIKINLNSNDEFEHLTNSPFLNHHREFEKNQSAFYQERSNKTQNNWVDFNDNFENQAKINQNPTENRVNKIDYENTNFEEQNYIEPQNKSLNSNQNEDNITDRVFILHVNGLGKQPLRGDELLAALLKEKMHFGEMSIFHYYLDDKKEDAIFSVANMMKPGTFNLEKMPQELITGIAFFMVVPCIVKPKDAFKLMLQTAQKVADRVGGIVLDDNHRMITPQKISEYFETIKQL